MSINTFTSKDINISLVWKTALYSKPHYLQKQTLARVVNMKFYLITKINIDFLF